MENEPAGLSRLEIFPLESTHKQGSTDRGEQPEKPVKKKNQKFIIAIFWEGVESEMGEGKSNILFINIEYRVMLSQIYILYHSIKKN